MSFDDRLLELVYRPRTVPEYATLAKHLRSHFEQWFAFVFDPQIEPTNWRAEQAIRPAVVNRKVWGGNRTDAGAQAQGVLMSVLETCRRQPLLARLYIRKKNLGAIDPKFLTAVDAGDRALRDVICVPLVRLAKPGNLNARDTLLEFLRELLRG